MSQIIMATICAIFLFSSQIFANENHPVGGNCSDEGVLTSTRKLGIQESDYKVLICKDGKLQPLDHYGFKTLMNGYYSLHEDSFDKLFSLYEKIQERERDRSQDSDIDMTVFNIEEINFIDSMVTQVERFHRVRFVLESSNENDLDHQTPKSGVR